MYKQNFRNQAVIELKNGSTATAVARKFSIATSTLKKWVKEYENNMYEITRDGSEQSTPGLTQKPKTGIRLKSIKVIIGGAAVTLGRNDVLKMLSLFDEFEKE